MAESELRAFDASKYLTSPEACASFLQEFVTKEEDQTLFLSTLFDVVKSHGTMTQVARDSSITREGLYKALSDKGNPSFFTVVKILKAVGLKITITPLNEGE